MARRARAVSGRPLTLIYGRQFFRTAQHLDASTRRALRATVDAIEAAADGELPGAADVRDILAPTTPCWRRRIGASAWWVFYELRDDRVVVVAVAIPVTP